MAHILEGSSNEIPPQWEVCSLDPRARTRGCVATAAFGLLLDALPSSPRRVCVSTVGALWRTSAKAALVCTKQMVAVRKPKLEDFQNNTPDPGWKQKV